MKQWVGLIVLAFTAACAFAADYPTKTIRIIAPFPPGGSVDLVARLEEMAAHLKSETTKWRAVFREQGIKSQ